MKTLKTDTMNPERIREMLHWLKMQIDHSKEVIRKSHEEGNFGREAQYEGMHEAYIQCLSQLNSQYELQA